MIYLDNSATTKPCGEAVTATLDAMRNHWGNPSSVHRLGMEANTHLTTARKQVATAMGAEADRIFFTSCGTEANNWAIFSGVKKMAKRGNHIITTAIEHHAVLNPMAQLALQGFDVTYLPPNDQGVVTLESLKNALRPDTIFVSIMMLNNETGAIMPISQMAKLVHRTCPDALFHTDAVQGLYRATFSAKSLGADMISVSGHKLHGPKGVGALYVRNDLSLPPHLYGGGQERGLRSGTEPLPAICGFGAALDAHYTTRSGDIAHMRSLKKYLLEELKNLPHVACLCDSDAPHVIPLAIDGMRSQELINRLQDLDIYVSAGSACSKGHRSHVLEAMGIPNSLIDGAIRISLCRETTKEEIDALLVALSSMTPPQGGTHEH